MKKILFTLLTLISIKLYSQESKYSLELNFPVLTENSFIKDNYSGIADFGFRVRFIKTNHLNIGFHTNASIFKFNGNVRESSFKTLYVIQPKIYTELNSLKKIRPQTGLGYTLMTYRKSGRVVSGINLNLGLSYDIIKNIFLQIQDE